MKTATYHQPESEGNRAFAVLQENKDGTVDLGPEGGAAVITSCRVTEQPEEGSCTIDKAEPAKSKEPAK
jgi:hypothetical protein